jgi:hypothetical protein
MDLREANIGQELPLTYAEGDLQMASEVISTMTFCRDDWSTVLPFSCARLPC